MPVAYYIGLISGTSMDAIDAALICMEDGQMRLIATHSGQYPQHIREQILPQLHAPETLPYGQIIQMELALADQFAATVAELLTLAQLKASQIRAIGSHGQTLCHRPTAATPYTVQLVDNARLAVLTGITVVGDFRRADVADGGQGAPLASLLHHALFSQEHQRVGIVNIGGIANLTLLPATRGAATEEVLGFDTGPGNGLMDQWCLHHQGRPYDVSGQWASQGQVLSEPLRRLLAEPYFALPPPKSTGREAFNLHWLKQQLVDLEQLAAVDVQATLLELSAVSIAQACENQSCDAVYLCGGGVHNRALYQRLETLLSCPLSSTAALGLDPDWVEASLFAWLAWRHLEAIPSPSPSITGATRARVLGACWPA